MNCNGLYLLCHANGQMYVYMIVSSVKIINKCNDFAMPIQVSQDSFVLMCVLGL